MLQEYNTFPSLKLSEKEKLPECSGIYFAIANNQILYIGQSRNIKNRWQNHHRLPQLEKINKRCEVKLFWLECNQNQLNEIEKQYINYYYPGLNNTKKPDRQIIPSFQTLNLSLKKLQEKVLVMGISANDNQNIKRLIIFYLGANFELRGITTNMRKTLQAINKKPNVVSKWIEFDRIMMGAKWKMKCMGIEIILIPWFKERIMHNPSMYKVMENKRFGSSMIIPEYDAIRKEVKMMSFLERLELARSLEIGWKVFPLECGAQFRSISGVQLLCLTNSQVKMLFEQHSYLQEQYPGVCAIDDDPIPHLMF